MKLSELNKRLEDPRPIKYLESIKLLIVIIGLAFVVLTLALMSKIRGIVRKA